MSQSHALSLPASPLRLLPHATLPEGPAVVHILRTERREARRSASDWLICGPIRLHRPHREVMVGHEPVQLRPREFALLEWLMDHPGHYFTRDELLMEIWGLGFNPGTNVVDVQVYTLRRKLARVGAGRVIETMRGVGYRANPAG